MLSEILKGRNQEVHRRFLSYCKEFSYLEFCSLSVMEILYGLHRKAATVQIQQATALFEANSEIVPYSEDYRLAALISARLDLSGRHIGWFDPIIAACAIQRDMVLVTGNTSHYQSVIDLGFNLKIDNWR